MARKLAEAPRASNVAGRPPARAYSTRYERAQGDSPQEMGTRIVRPSGAHASGSGDPCGRGGASFTRNVRAWLGAVGRPARSTPMTRQ